MTNAAGALDLPRILCLHGGGTSAEIFQLQCRGIINRLSDTFRFVFVNGPWESKPHEAIVPFFGDSGPFYRWLRWEGDHGIDEDAERKLLDHVKKAMDSDKGKGDWVAVLGFSQGGKLAASLLWAHEKIQGNEGLAPWKFGVIMAGRAPVVVIDPENKKPGVPYTADMNQMSTEFTNWAPDNKGEHALSTPTLHVHGLQDLSLEFHRRMLRDYCKDGTGKLVEWDGDHRLPIKPADIAAVSNGILQLAEKTGAIYDDCLI